MRVPTNSISQTLVSQLQQITLRQAELQNQVSTGQRITKLSDDPAAAAQVLNLEAEKQQLSQYSQNNIHATDVSRTTYAGVSELKKLSDRAGELGILGTGAASPEANKAYAIEVNQMVEQAIKIGNTRFGGDYLFAGTKSDQPPFSVTRNANGDATGVSYQGAAAGPAFNVAENATVSPFTDGQTNQKFADFMSNLIALRDGLQSNNQAAIKTTQGNLQTSEDDLISTISNVGSVQARLEADSSQNQARFTALQDITSQKTDVNIAEAQVRLTQSQTSYQAALHSGAQILRMSLLDYLR
jgi:flagellar hook-associated protein 3 FlgL